VRLRTPLRAEKYVHLLPDSTTVSAMFQPVATNDPAAVEAAARSAFVTIFPDADAAFIPQAFCWAVEAFTGKYQDYQAVDAHYHDFEHTLQGTLCFARLLQGWHAAEANGGLTPRVFQLGLIAILLHDTGYLKQRSDLEGTGAKYTITHVSRSAVFAGELLAEKGLHAEDIKAVQNMIRCTGVESNLGGLAFQSEVERLVGLALATADILGQMAAADYVDKLPILYSEFVEAVRFSQNTDHFIASFSSPADLMQRTPGFWRDDVLKKLDTDFRGLYRFLSEPYPHGPNPYLQQIERNMQRLQTPG
jgi:hypothetical protein